MPTVSIGPVKPGPPAGLRGETRRFFRPRLVLYAVLGVVGLAVAGAAAWRHTDWDAQLVRVRGVPYVVDGELCSTCGVCFDACPHDVLMKGEDGVPYKCDFCWACTEVCNTGALVRAESGGRGSRGSAAARSAST